VASVLDKYIKQVGSNTGAAVTPSGINAYNIDPRIGQQYQDLVSTVNSGISGQPAGTDVLSKYLTQLTDLSKPAQKKKNALQSILSNRAVQIGLKPLEVLDYGRRAVTSTLKEAYDYGKTGEFSTEDWRKQTNDPTFGVGKFVNTGNKWLDRGVGFLGDVALDPVNYVTLGAGTFIGAGGRAALATRLLEAGASEAVVSKAGKLGLAGLKSAEREAYNLPRAGLYLGQNIRIPGTGLPGSGLGRTLAETRGLVGSTPVGGVIRRARTPEAFIEASERLATGKGALSAREATAILSSAKYMAGAEGMALARINQELTLLEIILVLRTLWNVEQWMFLWLQSHENSLMTTLLKWLRLVRLHLKCIALTMFLTFGVRLVKRFFRQIHSSLEIFVQRLG
jgi:hypothetical protein